MQQSIDFTARLRKALADGSQPAGLCPDRPAEAARRFAVYRNNVAHSLGRALAQRYPVIERLVGEEFFAAMARSFIAVHPPRTPVLQEWGAEFARFLRGFPPVATLPYLPDVARLEWVRGLAYHAADARPILPASLARRRVLRLHPSLSLLRLAHPAVSIWQANQPGQDGRVRASGPENALIWRQQDFEVATIALSSSDAAFMRELCNGQPLVGAAVQTDPVAMLALLLREQLICEED
ncbi:DNA-binding domain-containing protein [Paracoccus sp. (in: a-proteobacteria)]|uniref:HvfC/BufC N-terminal domain-containing protein n=1 Tax=Paracoccus sp. TaxID=267 RepID=UPI003A8C6676